MISGFDGPAVAAARGVRSLARVVQVVAPVLAVLSVVGAVLLATRRVAAPNCVRIDIIGGSSPDCVHHSGAVIAVAVAGELAVLFALLVVVLAARFAAFQAEVYLAHAERGAVSTDA